MHLSSPNDPVEEPPSDGPPVSDDYGSTPETSGSLGMNSEIQGIVESGGDRDWFSISLDAGSTYKFDLEACFYWRSLSETL